MSWEFLVARSEQTAFVRVKGLANLACAPLLEGFLLAEAEKGMTMAFVDLGECKGMDSTFMGVLVGSHFTLRETGGRLVVVNPTDSGNKLLDMLGVSKVMPVLEAHPLPEVAFFPLQGSASLTNMERVELIRRAHEHLVQLSGANRARFAAFLAAIDRDLAQARAAVTRTVTK